MKVLWFEVTTPKRYLGGSGVLAGWQDSLEAVVRGMRNVELFVAFEAESESDASKIDDGVTYMPMHISYSLRDKVIGRFSWSSKERKVVAASMEVVNEVKPDIIHIFGCEWPFGLIAERTEIPVVVHIQGSIIPYHNALYPPKYNIWNYVKALKLNVPRLLASKLVEINNESRSEMERKIWSKVSFFMGRTNWDHALANVMHPHCTYFHVEEALRPFFLDAPVRWLGGKQKSIRLFTTGCTTFWKGPDMLLKTARILKDLCVDFEWLVAGNFPDTIKKVVENSEKCKFSDCGVNFIGTLQPSELVEELSESTMYVHTAYIENSPNSICEAQALGVPVVSTNVGGIATLLGNGVGGVLIPANDPWQMAYEIVTLASDEKKLKEYSQNGYELAHKRHNVQNIQSQLMGCYMSILANNDKTK